MGNVNIPPFSVEGGGKSVRTLCLTFSSIGWETPNSIITCSFPSFSFTTQWVARFSTTVHSTSIRPLLFRTLLNQARLYQLQVSRNALVAKVSCSFLIMLPHTPHSYHSSIPGANQSVSLAKVNYKDDPMSLQDSSCVNRVVERSIMLVSLVMMLPG